MIGPVCHGRYIFQQVELPLSSAWKERGDKRTPGKESTENLGQCAKMSKEVPRRGLCRWEAESRETPRFSGFCWRFRENRYDRFYWYYTQRVHVRYNDRRTNSALHGERLRRNGASASQGNLEIGDASRGWASRTGARSHRARC